MLALAGLLLGQTLVPCGLLLSSVHAAELQRSKTVVSPQKIPLPFLPLTTEVERRAWQSARERNLRLAQLQRPAGNGSEPSPELQPSEDVDCLDCEVDALPLDLSTTPTETALRRAGQSEGALNPVRNGEPEELGRKLDVLLKLAGIENGLSGQLSPKDPRAPGLERAREDMSAPARLIWRLARRCRRGTRATACRPCVCSISI